MLSFEKKESKEKIERGQRIARVDGPDVTEEIYLKDTDLGRSNLDAFNCCQLLAQQYGHKVKRGERNETVDLLQIVGSYLQFYGTNKITLSPDRPVGQTQVISLFGAPGSGKSTWIGKYMDDYKKVYPDGKIIVISRKTKEDEPEFRQEYQQVVVDEDFLDRPFNIDDIKLYQKENDTEHITPFLVVYDDTSTFKPSEQRKIQESLEDLIKVGRSFNVTVIVSSHVINDGARTKVLHASSTHSVFFIQSHKEKVEECFRKRLKFSPDLTDYLLDQKSRWVCLANSYPQYVLSETMIATLNSLTDYFKKRK